MSISSYGALHEFLFHLRTPLAGIRGAASLASRAETIGISVPPEAYRWLEKWLPKVNTWWEEAVELTELLGNAKSDHQDWKGLTQQLISSLADIEIAAREAHSIPLTDPEEVGDIARMMVHQIDYIYNHYKYMQEEYPELE